MASDAWSLDLSRGSALRRGDLFSLRLSQPLRIRSGGYVLSLPVSYDYSDLSVGYQSTLYALAPNGREMDLEAAYLLPLFDGRGSVSTHAFLRRQPGHVAAAEDDVGAAVRLSFDF
jgi:hypothetical protein